MKTTVNSIRNLSTERSAKVKPLMLELNTVIRDDSTPADYRQRRERELRADINSTNDEYNRRIGEAALEAAKEPQQRYAAGSPLKPEHLGEVGLIVEEYRHRPARQERAQLTIAIRDDLAAGNTTGARIKARAAQALNIPLGPLAAQLNDADPAKRDARDTLDVIEGLVELALAEPVQELALAGLATVSERVALKAFADQRGLRPDAPFTAQVEPGYAGPSVEHAGTPVNPFPESHDPERDRQRAQMERIGRDAADPADTVARYEARGEQPSDGKNLRLHD